MRAASKAFLAALAKSRARKLGTPGSVSAEPPARASRRRRPPTSKESPVVTAIIAVLSAMGFWCWRANSGLHVIEEEASHERRVIKGAPAGTPDILLVLPTSHTKIHASNGRETFRHDIGQLGVLCGLEVKRPTTKQNKNQVRWEQRAIKNGVRYAVVRSIKEAIAAVRSFQKDLAA